MVTSATLDSGLSSAPVAPTRGARAEQRERTTKNDLTRDIRLLSRAGPAPPTWTASPVGEFLDLQVDDVVGLALDSRGRPAEAVELGVSPVQGRQIADDSIDLAVQHRLVQAAASRQKQDPVEVLRVDVDRHADDLVPRL